MKAFSVSLVFLTITFFAVNIQPKIFEWVDDRGVKHFSDRPITNTFEQTFDKKIEDFIPLSQDMRPASEKLASLQGIWIQTHSSPSIPELINLMNALWDREWTNEITVGELEGVLTVQGNRITLQNRASEALTQSNTYKSKEYQKHGAKLEFYNGIPLEVGGDWSFEQGFNPIVTGFLEQIEANNNMWQHSEQIRFDVEASKLMVTVKLPAEFKTSALKIIYEKQYSAM